MEIFPACLPSYGGSDDLPCSEQKSEAGGSGQEGAQEREGRYVVLFVCSNLVFIVFCDGLYLLFFSL